MTPVDRTVSLLLGLRIALGALAARRARPCSLAERLANLPLRRAPVDRPVAIHWSGHGVPFIEAEGEADAAVGLGLVHAHLRLTQMEIMRRLAWGQLAEMLGPAAVELDHALRALGIARAVPAMVLRLNGPARGWTEGFVAGINHVVRHAPRLPPEFAPLGLGREPWSVADVLAVGRLAAADVNWPILFHLLKLRHRPDWPALWRDLAYHQGAVFSPLLGEDDDAVARAAAGLARSGSNAVAVAMGRSATGAALMAADPHLSLLLPNVWLLAGVASPGLNATGLMIPGLPFFAIGRNRRIAWSGTSLQAAASELVDVSALPPQAFRPAPERIRARWSGAHRRRHRVTPFGPVVSDAAPLRHNSGENLALSWVGHRPGDELGAWLALNRAANWPEFAAAAERMGVPGQQLLYADVDGHIGRLVAAHLPPRPHRRPGDVVLQPEEAPLWRRPVASGALPRQFDPADGVLVSANEAPEGALVPVGLFFPARDRWRRMVAVLAELPRISPDDLARLQRDVMSEGALRLKHWLCARAEATGIAVPPVLRGWDGSYDEDSHGAAAFEAVLERLHRFVHGDAGQAAYWSSWNPMLLLEQRLHRADPAALNQALAGAMAAAVPARHWGDIHRLRLGHVLALLPVVGRRFVFTDLPSPGGNETLHKTAHGLAAGRHAVRFGANARLVFDLSGPDASRAVLLGGNDGWLGLANLLDHLPLWRAGDSLPLPLRPEAARRMAVATTVLTPLSAPR